MPRILALEWDRTEVRLVLAATARGGRLRVLGAVQAPLPPSASEEPLPAEELGAAIRTVVRAHKLAAGKVLVGVSRSSVELRELSLPPAPDDELPELVRHQSVRELGNMAEGTRLDFVVRGENSGQPRPVMVAALPGERYERIAAVCQAAGLKPQRLLLRPYAAAGLLARRESSDQAVLLVEPTGDELSLTAMAQGQVVYSRTVRLAEADSPDAERAALVAEIHRTAMAVRNLPAGGPLQAIFIVGDQRQDALSGEVESQLDIATRPFDPFESLPVAGELPTQRGRFAALLGGLADEAENRRPAIDFVNPRKQRRPVSRARLVLVGGIVAAVAASAAGYFAWDRFARIDDQIAQLVEESRELDQVVKRAAAQQEAAQAIEEWLASDVTWLDELREFSQRFPKPRDAVLLRLTLASRPSGGGTMDFEGLVRAPSIVERMETRLRDPFHLVSTKRVQESIQGQSYTWRFDSSVTLGRRHRDEYLRPVTASAPQPAGSTSAAGAASADESAGGEEDVDASEMADDEVDTGPAADDEVDAGPAADDEVDTGPAADDEADAGPAADDDVDDDVPDSDQQVP